jgi:hypothetical protein
LSARLDKKGSKMPDTSSENRTPLDLEAPTVPAALHDGLLPTDVLSVPLEINLTVWAAAEPKYTYELLWSGVPVPPQKEIQETDLPGGALKLEVPIPLLIEGEHKVAYRIYSPFSDTHVDSKSTIIKIDKTAPGAPQLAPIIFPDAIQNGLTSSELESLNNVLPGKIAGYSGISEGDVIRTYWGSLEGPITFVSANDMGLDRVMVDFSRALLEQVGDVEASVHYTVTDQAGNLSMPSDAVSVDLKLSVVTPLPAPTIKEAVGDTLDPAAAADGATFVIDASADLKMGELVVLRWNGPKASDHKERVITANGAGQALDVVFPYALISPNDGQTVEVFYSVTRTSGTVQDSDTVPLKIQSAVLELPAPTMDTVGADGVVRPSLIPESGATVRVSYRGMNAGDIVMVRWLGTSVENTPAQTVGSQTHLTFNLPKTAISASEGHAASLSYFVKRDGKDRESEKLALTVYSGLELDTSQALLDGKIYLLPGWPDVTPAYPKGTTVQRVPKGGVPPYFFTSSDPAVAKVDSLSGLVRVRSRGNATITVKDSAGEIKSYNVLVAGVIECHKLSVGNLTQVTNAASAIQARVPSIHELIEIYNAYGSSWPMGQANYWSSTVAKDVFGAKWYYVKNLLTGQDFKLLHISSSQGIAIR